MRSTASEPGSCTAPLRHCSAQACSSSPCLTSGSWPCLTPACWADTRWLSASGRWTASGELASYRLLCALQGLSKSDWLKINSLLHKSADTAALVAYFQHDKGYDFVCLYCSPWPEGEYQFSTLWGGYVQGKAQSLTVTNHTHQLRDGASLGHTISFPPRNARKSSSYSPQKYRNAVNIT